MRLNAVAQQVAEECRADLHSDAVQVPLHSFADGGLGNNLFPFCKRQKLFLLQAITPFGSVAVRDGRGLIGAEGHDVGD